MSFFKFDIHHPERTLPLSS